MRRKKIRLRRRGHHPDYLILSCFALLVIFGLVMLASASSDLGKIQFGDTYFYLKHQIIYGFSFGLIGFFLTSKIYYGRWEKISLWLLLFSIFLLALVFTPLGTAAKGSSRWLAFGPITFQPSEILKFTFIVYLAAWLGRKTERQKKLGKGFLPFLTVTGVIALLLLKQPATSITAILIATAVIVYFISGAKLRYIASAGFLLTVIFMLVIYFTPYRLERILAYLNPETNLETSGFHLNQARIAIGSGRLIGVGYGKSTTKISYLPEPIGDSIFAVIAEELGFIGVSVLIFVFFLLVLRIFLIAKNYRDKFGQLLLFGFGALLTLQVAAHIGSISGILPLTGTPLPFISFGGTALAVFMTISGMIVNISKYS